MSGWFKKINNVKCCSFKSGDKKNMLETFFYFNIHTAMHTHTHIEMYKLDSYGTIPMSICLMQLATELTTPVVWDAGGSGFSSSSSS